jgi:hypothetical protein
MSLLPWADEREVPESDVRTLPTAFVRKELRCERCHASLPLLRGETAREFADRQRCKNAGCKRQDRRSAIVEAPARHGDVLESEEAL